MDPLKEEFTRLIAIMGWNKSEAARELHMSHSAVNHLLNPDHSNKPRPSTLQLLKLIVSNAHPEAMEMKNFTIKDEPLQLREDYWTAEERELIQRLRGVPKEKQDEIRRVIAAMLASVPQKAVHYGKKAKG